MRTRRALAGLALAALAACSGGGSSGTVVAPSPSPAPSPTPSPSPSPSPIPLPTPTPSPKSPASYTPTAAFKPSTGIALPVGKCVNMGNQLDAPNEGDWGRAIVDADFTIIKAAGFDTVRLPVRWSNHAATSAPYTIDAIFMARVQHVVDTARAAGLNVILDVHHYDALYANPSAEAARFAALWQQIGAAFASAPVASLWFELLNEPNGALDDSNLRSILDPALAAVRATNPTRPVIIGGQNWSNVASLTTLQLPNDPYVVATVHIYDPFDFTHQGATWITPTPPLGRTFGTASDYSQLDTNLLSLQAYMQRTGRSVFVGEYGANDDPAIPLEQRVLYYTTMSRAYASVGVQSCAWAYTNTFRLRDGNAWLQGMIEGIATTTTLQ